MIPRVMFRFELPEPLIDGRAFERLHERCVKEALREVMEAWHRRILPEHFTTNNRTKYRHQERRPGWKAKKMNVYGSRTDLVASGRTKRFMLSAFSISLSGSAYGGGVVCTLTLRFPFPASFTFSSNRVSLEQMAKEIGTITREEADAMAADFLNRYTAKLNAGLAKSPKLRKRIAGGTP
jgi:hypothetical protein